MKKALLVAFLGSLSLLEAFSQAPWFGPLYCFNGEVQTEISHFSAVDTPAANLPYDATNAFIGGNLTWVPDPNWEVGLGISFAHTREQSFNLEQGAVQGRYLILDDVSGEDPISLVAALELDFPLTHSLKDINCLHHWYIEGQFSLAAGKEWHCGGCWTWRCWGLLGVGTGGHGPGWLVEMVRLEGARGWHRWMGGLQSRQGFGHQDLTAEQLTQFDGYAPIQYRFALLEASYSYEWFPWCTLTVGANWQFAQKNFPKSVKTLLLRIEVPFAP